MEASVRLVGTEVFKTDEGVQAPCRVRFPSASSKSMRDKRFSGS